MKRIDVYIPTAKRNSVIDAIIELGVEGVTFVRGNGKGQRKRPTVGGNRGTTRTISEYNNIDYITTVVDDSKINKVIDTIMDAAHTGFDVDGKIFVYTVEKSYDITNRRRK
jgi:nitrogen regulatory protein P-II 1